MATFEERLVAAFNGEGLKKIAEELRVNYHTLRNWAKETRPIPPEMLKEIATRTNVSLSWLLLERGPRTVEQLGFDIGYSVDRNEDWMKVIDEWYDFEGKINPMPEGMGASFMGGWKSFDREKRIAAIIDFKKFLDLTFQVKKQ